MKHTPYYETAIFSAGGTVQAAERIWEGEIDNAFVFTGTGDHHAGRNFFIPRILRRLTGDQEEKLLFTGRGKLGKDNLL